MQHPKSVLIERSKQLGLGKPSFATHNSGPAHEPLFVSDVSLRAQVYGHGEAGNKRDAERLASEAALTALAERRQGERPEPERAPETYTDEPFEGPWPIFSGVLAASLRIANARVNPTLTGTEAINEVQELALQLYKGTLENLGEVTEIDEDDA